MCKSRDTVTRVAPKGHRMKTFFIPEFEFKFDFECMSLSSEYEIESSSSFELELEFWVGVLFWVWWFQFDCVNVFLHLAVNPFTPEWSMSKFPCSLTRNMTSHSMENLTFHSLLRWKVVIIQILATSLIQSLLERLGEYTFLAQEWKG